MKKAIVFLANGFEEMEATGTVDILRRGGIDTKTVSITDDRKVIGAHNMEYTADATFTEIDLSDADALILPGGMPGASNLNNSEPVKEALLQQYREGRIGYLRSSDGIRRSRFVKRSQSHLLSRVRTEIDWCHRNRRGCRGRWKCSNR